MRKCFLLLKISFLVKIGCMMLIPFILLLADAVPQISGFPNVCLALMPFSIITIPVSIFAGVDYALVSLAVFIVTLILWLICIIFFIISFKKNWARMAFLVSMSLASILDFASSFLVNNVALKISCILVSALLISLCAINLHLITRDRKSKT